MKLWVCIPVFNRRKLTVRCLETLMQQNYADFQVVVFDDGSTDGTAQYLESHFPSVAVLLGDGNQWWTGATNGCIEYVLERCSEEDAIVTLNNDLEVEPDYLDNLAAAARRYPDALIGSAGHDIDNGERVDAGYRQDWLKGTSRQLDPPKDSLPDDPDIAAVTHLPGRGTLIPVRILRHIGLFDFKRLPHYGADNDLSFRAARFGYRVLIAYKARVLSHVAETGLTKIRENLSLRSFYEYLTSRRSPGNLKVRFWIAIKNCPTYLIPSYLLVDGVRVLGSYVRYHLKSTGPLSKAG